MSDAVVIGLFGMVASVISVVGTVLIAYLQVQTRRDVSDVKMHTNSLVDQAVKQAGLIGHARGIEEERTSTIERAADQAAIEAERINQARRVR